MQHPTFSTVIDFFDYAIGTLGHAGDRINSVGAIYPLEEYRTELVKLCDAGIRKFYLRVNIAGKTLYPTQAGTRASFENAGYMTAAPGTPQSAGQRRCFNTLTTYDPLQETIRIVRELGGEIWAWENLFEDSGFQGSMHIDEIRKHGKYYAMDPRFRPDFSKFVMLRPDQWEVTPDSFAARNRAAAGRTIGKIIFVSEADTEPIRFDADELFLSVSDDNELYHDYTGTMRIGFSRLGRRNCITFDNLAIQAQYVKIGHRQIFPQDKSYTMLWKSTRGVSRVYDLEGLEIPSVWGGTFNFYDRDTVMHDWTLDFGRTMAVNDNWAFDYFTRQVGFALGEPDLHPDYHYRVGQLELTIPDVMEYKVAKFAELAAYDFDGFMFSPRTHSLIVENINDYGFNPEVREKYLQRYGVDIYAPGFNELEQLHALRGEAVDEFFRRCKQWAGQREIRFTLPPPAECEYPPPQLNRDLPVRTTYWNSFGKLKFNFEQYLADGSIGGLHMIFWQDPGYFSMVKAQYPELKIGKFQEGWELNEMGVAKFLRKLERTFNSPGIDEIELYEAMIFSHYHPEILPYLQSLINQKKI